MRALSLALAALVLGVGCARSPTPVVADAGTSSPDAEEAPTDGGRSASDAGTPIDAGSIACVDTPSDVPRPPTGPLPCTLLPPTR